MWTGFHLVGAGVGNGEAKDGCGVGRSVVGAVGNRVGAGLGGGSSPGVVGCGDGHWVGNFVGRFVLGAGVGEYMV